MSISVLQRALKMFLQKMFFSLYSKSIRIKTCKATYVFYYTIPRDIVKFIYYNKPKIKIKEG